MMITKMTRFNMKDFNKPNEPFVVSGRIIPSFENNVWTYTEEKFAEPYVKNMTMMTLMSVILKKRIKLSFYYAENDCVGRSKLRSNWNGYALIEDIAVAKDYRKMVSGRLYYIKRLSGQRRIIYAVLCLKHKILMFQLVILCQK